MMLRTPEQHAAVRAALPAGFSRGGVRPGDAAERDLRAVLAAAENPAAVDDPAEFGVAVFAAARPPVACDMVFLETANLVVP
jgi:hypothetical protein